MYIKVIYKDTPELSNLRRKSSLSDLSAEKTLLVNPQCYIRVMLEHIRKACRLGIAHFDLCDENGCLRGLAGHKSYDYATTLFENKMTYYVIVLIYEGDIKRATVMPQLNWSNAMYDHLVARVKQFLLTGTAMSPVASSGKSTPPAAPKKPIKKK